MLAIIPLIPSTEVEVYNSIGVDLLRLDLKVSLVSEWCDMAFICIFYMRTSLFNAVDNLGSVFRGLWTDIGSKICISLPGMWDNLLSSLFKF